MIMYDTYVGSQKLFELKKLFFNYAGYNFPFK